MKRNYAGKDCINEINALRKAGIKMFFCSTSYEKDGKVKHLKPVIKGTAAGISAYANDMYIRYGDTVSVRVTYYDHDLNQHVSTTYSC